LSVGPEFSSATKPVTSKASLICRMGHSRANVRKPTSNLHADAGGGRGQRKERKHERQKERRQQTMLDARGVKCKSGVLRS
jgi:hypothetical protein